METLSEIFAQIAKRIAHSTDFTIIVLSNNSKVTEMEKPKRISKQTMPFIVSEKLEELGLYTLEEFQCLYREAVGGNAKTLASFLKKYRELKVLDFDGKNKKQIFNKLQECFPDQIKYDYNNFISYY